MMSDIPMDVAEKFMEFETSNGLFNRQIRGIYYWNVIRFYLNVQICKKVFDWGESQNNYGSFSTIKKIWMHIPQIWNVIFKNPVLFLKKKDIVIINHPRRIKVGNNNHCLYTDLLIENMDYSYMVYEYNYLYKHIVPIPTKQIRYTDYFTWKIAVYRFFCSKYSLSETGELKDLVIQINTFFNVALDVEATVKTIAGFITIHHLCIKYFTKILRKIKPRVIIEVVYYTSICMAINEAAKKLNIPTIELQHGTISKNHCAYNFHEKMLIPSFPDYVFLFGSYWKGNMRLPIDDVHTKVVGWPFYEQKIKELKNISKKETEDVILFISQGTIGKELSRVAADVAGKLDAKQFKIIYKLHPGEYTRWKKAYPWLLGARLSVVCDNEVDIHHYFRKASVQVGVYSTALYEGLGYGVRTFIWKLPGYEAMQGLIDANMAASVEGCDEFIEKLLLPEQSAGGGDISALWQPDSLKNMVFEIDKILAMEKEGRYL